MNQPSFKERFPKRFGALLVEDGLITEEQLNEALVYQAEHKTRTGQSLMALKYVTEDEVARALSKQLDIKFISDLYDENINKDLVDQVDINILRKNNFIPISFEEKGDENKIIVVCADIYNEIVCKTCVDVFKCKPVYRICRRSGIERWIKDYIREMNAEKGRARGLIEGDAEMTNTYDLNSPMSDSYTVQQLSQIII